MEQPILRAEHEEFKTRIEEHFKRNDRRIGDLEETIRQIADLTASVHSLALSVENIAKSQTRQEEKLEELEGRDGEKWRQVSGYILTLILGAVVAIVLTKIGFA